MVLQTTDTEKDKIRFNGISTFVAYLLPIPCWLNYSGPI